MTYIESLRKVWKENPELAKRILPCHLRSIINNHTEEILASEQLLCEIDGFDSVRKDMGDFGVIENEWNNFCGRAFKAMPEAIVY